MQEPLDIRHDAAARRYEGWIGDRRVTVVDYVDRGDTVVFPHTQTLPEYEGRGLATAVVRRALDDVTAQGRRPVGTCWFVADFLRRNPEYAAPR